MNPFLFILFGLALSLLALADSIALYYVLVLRNWNLTVALFILAGTVLSWLGLLFFRRKDNVANAFSLFPLLATPVVAFCPASSRFYFGIWIGAAALCLLLRLSLISTRNLARAAAFAASKWAPHFLIFAAALLFFCSPHLRFLTLDESSEGLRIGVYHAIKHGQWPVAEAGYGYGPLFYLVEYLLIDLFGGTLFACRAQFLFTHFTAFAFLYFFLCQAVRSVKLRFLGALLLICFTTLSYLATNPTLMFGTVSLLRIAVAMWALFLFMKWIEKKSAMFLFLSGFFSVFSFFYSAEYGLAVLGTCLLYLFISIFKKPAKGAAAFGAYLFGCLVMASLVLIPYQIHGFGPIEVISKTIEHMFGLGTALISNPAFKWIPFLRVEASQSLFSWEFQLLIPMILYPLAFFWISRLTRRNEELFVLCLFGAACSLLPYLNPSGTYYLYCTTPPLIILMLALWETLKRRFNIAGLALLVWFTVTHSGFLNVAEKWVGGRTYDLSSLFLVAFSPMTHPKAGGIYTYELQNRAIEELVHAIEEKTAPGEKILILSSPGVFLFFSDRLNATRFYFIREPAIWERQEKEIVADLIKNKTTHVFEMTKNSFYKDLNRLLDEKYTGKPLIPGITLYTLNSEPLSD